MQAKAKHFRVKRLALALAASVLTVSVNTHALEFDFDNSELQIDWDTNVSYGLMWRVQSAAPVEANTDDGTNNFDTGIVSNKITVVSEADFNWGNYGLFLRGKALYDYRYENQDTDQTAETYFTDNSGNGGGNWTTDIFGVPVGGSVGNVAPEDFHPDTLDLHGKDAFWLDAFLYGDFVIADRMLNARLGRQVVSWGESQFFPGISGTQTYLDASAAQAPGTAVKEIYMPTGQLYGNFEISPSVSVEAYWQYEWEETRQAGVGSYWSNADVTGAGAERFLVIQEDVPVLGSLAVPFDVIGADEPEGTSEQSQWGIALRYFMDDGTELGFYRTRFHDKFLSVRSILNEDPGLPQLAQFPEALQDYYQQDVDLWGASFSTLLGGIQVNGELSYQEDALPTQETRPTVDAATGEIFVPEFQTGYVTQGNLGLLQIFGAGSFYDGATFIGEAVYVRTNLRPSDLAEEGISMKNTKNAWGYTFTGTLQYKSVVSGLDIDVPLSFKHSPRGTWKSIALSDGAKSASIGARFKYLTAWKADIKYTSFWGAKKTHRNHDRDNISMSVTYTF